MNIRLTESQLRLLFEEKNSLESLQRLIDPKDFIFQYGPDDSFIIPKKITLEGDVGEISVGVEFDKITYKGQDITDFVYNYVFTRDYDSRFVSVYSHHVADILNKGVMRLISTTVTDYDVFYPVVI